MFRSEVVSSSSRTRSTRRISVRSCLKFFPNEEHEKDFGQKLSQVLPEQGGREGFRSEVVSSSSRTRRPRSVSVGRWLKFFPNEEHEKDFGQKLSQVLPERGAREGFRSEAVSSSSRTRRPRSVSVRSCLKFFPNEEHEKDFGQKLSQVLPERGGREVFRSEDGSSCSRTGRARRISVRSCLKFFPNEEAEKDFGQKLSQVLPERGG
ncbi:hypothetical protein, partial [Evansella tamaricis]|uniref:hypothetical protein n=1 Tax=Evansella tamaricis TaxID=2069301 RepID=UPI00364294FA